MSYYAKIFIVSSVPLKLQRLLLKSHSPEILVKMSVFLFHFYPSHGLDKSM